MPHRLGTLSVLLALLLAPLAVPTPAGAATPEQTYANQAVRATNAVRANHDRGAVKKNACLRKAAAQQARKMAAQQRLFHQDLGPLLQRCGLSAVGENVAVGYPTGRAVVRQGWMKSPGHRANILNGQFNRVGIAARRADNGQWYAAQVLGRTA